MWSTWRILTRRGLSTVPPSYKSFHIYQRYATWQNSTLYRTTLMQVLQHIPKVCNLAKLAFLPYHPHTSPSTSAKGNLAKLYFLPCHPHTSPSTSTKGILGKLLFPPYHPHTSLSQRNWENSKFSVICIVSFALLKQIDAKIVTEVSLLSRFCIYIACCQWNE